MVDEIECFPKVKEHHAHSRTVAVSILIPVVEHADQGMHCAGVRNSPILVLVNLRKDGRLDVAVNDKLFPDFGENWSQRNGSQVFVHIANK